MAERLFDEGVRQLDAQGLIVKSATSVDATVIALAVKGDEDARWVGHRRKKPAHGYRAHVARGAETDIVRAVLSLTEISV